MITCYLTYEVDPDQLEAFEIYAKAWIPLVERFGGAHHGYFLPYESANDLAVALFSFPSLATYEEYRAKSFEDADCLAAFKFAQENKIIRRYDRTFLRPVLEGDLQPLQQLTGCGS
ncbi:NIPSNAP family protein [Roseobacter sp. SK209-2-6]|uniref:NIPSNAP family protein n=1 Tax=Roseobacter sp. SK209-2-6 TaxID=388739 RepID=UPI0002DAE140|nr:NIPSNAP family protein [Roseobacter sp. SK209-2-6]